MADGQLYKYNASTASNTVAKKFTATAVSDAFVKHASATTWYVNYPKATTATTSASAENAEPKNE